MRPRLDVLCGIFVGGAARRMGGAPKGLLPARDTGEPLVVRLARIANALGFEPVLVGQGEGYGRVLPATRVIADEPSGIGPLGGLGGLLHAALGRPVIALACDMPHVSAALLTRLAHESPEAMVLAPKSAHGAWEPLCARYETLATRPLFAAALARGVRSFQRLFETLDVQELSLSARERVELTDWDCPGDIER